MQVGSMSCLFQGLKERCLEGKALAIWHMANGNRPSLPVGGSGWRRSTGSEGRQKTALSRFDTLITVPLPLRRLLGCD